MKALDYGNLLVIRDNEAKRLKIEIGAPTVNEIGDECCVLDFEGFGLSFKKNIIGATRQQALLLAISSANYHILNSDEFAAGQVFCEFPDGSREKLTAALLGDSGALERW